MSRSPCVAALLFVLLGSGLAALLGSSSDRLAIGWAWAQQRVSKPATVQDRLDQFGAAARERLAPHYASAGLAYPGQRVALLAFKDARRLALYVQAADGDWRFVRDWPVQAASGRLGPKLREGDLQVPEGFYRVTFLNANSLYHVSLRLDYPNAFDREMARAEGRRNLGGDIMIHGRAVSIGCLAMGDPAAEELFTLAADIGMARVQVLIAPTDFRFGPGEGLPQSPAWLPDLYRRLDVALQDFPLPADADSVVAPP
jgi:hypothetical protein